MSRIEASHHDAAVAYLAVSAYRSGNYAPLVYRTADKGRTWQSIAGDLPPDGPAKVVREDPRNPNLLYVGTEFGLFVSFDRGGRWTRLGGLPTVAVDDVVVQPRERDLVIATHGRSLYILDDIAFLEDLSTEVQEKAAHLFPPRPALGSFPLPGFAEWNANAVFRGENPPEGALMTYWLKEFTGEPVKIAIADASGRPVANLTGPSTPGFSRVSWDLKVTKDLLTEYGGEGQKFVHPGEYKVTLTCGKAKSEQALKVEIAEGIETR
jgi:hypothetical protein